MSGIPATKQRKICTADKGPCQYEYKIGARKGRVCRKIGFRQRDNVFKCHLHIASVLKRWYYYAPGHTTAKAQRDQLAKELTELRREFSRVQEKLKSREAMSAFTS